MTNNTIALKSIKELLGMKFIIPNYQRGYRWTKQQVSDLINDLRDFKSETNQVDGQQSWYCLQPLVIKKMSADDVRLKDEEDKNDWVEVIDGQQRLTTIFLIFNILDKNSSLSIKYQTRPNSKEYIRKISGAEETGSKANLDYFYMFAAKQTIEKAFANCAEQQKEQFITKLKNCCKVIWYEIEEDDAYEVFKRLNSGKIPLSNAELVKALFLKDDNFKVNTPREFQLLQSEMAGDWDRMEQTFHHNDFWYFINPYPESARYNCTRMDFLLELILRCEKNEEGNFRFDVDAEINGNAYFVFLQYSRQIQEEGHLQIWQKVQSIFRFLKSCYDDRAIYHYLGYLMNLKGGEPIETLKNIVCEAGEQTKTEFLHSLKKRCQESIGLKNDTQFVKLNELEYGAKYGANNKELHNILLLFNLATTQNQISEMSRYPFDKHFEAAKKKWSLEHIHAQNEKQANWTPEQLEAITNFLKNLPQNNGVKELCETLETQSFEEVSKSQDIYNAVIAAFMGKTVRKEAVDGKEVFVSDFEKDDHLTNMALLQGDKNAAFNNKTYPEKRAKLAEYENVEMESLFVPVCTRNVFFKHYSPSSNNPFVWDEQAGLEYVEKLCRVVAAYLDVEPFFEEDGHIYGLKKELK